MKAFLEVWLVLLLSMALPLTASAAMYAYIDDQGVRRYTNIPGKGRFKLIARPQQWGGTPEIQSLRSIAPRSSSTCGTSVLAPDELFEKVKDSVVVLRVLDEKGKPMGQGSGVVLPSGRIATNFHVVEGGATFQVIQNKRRTKGTIHAANKGMDMCLLNVQEAIGKPVELGSASTLKVGKTVYAVGAPQGLELSLSNGLVSQLRGGPPPIIQTTTAISPGSSGGGLFDEGGCLVGLTTLHMKDGQNLNFAMPVEWIGAIGPAGTRPLVGMD